MLLIGVYLLENYIISFSFLSFFNYLLLIYKSPINLLYTFNEYYYYFLINLHDILGIFIIYYYFLVFNFISNFFYIFVYYANNILVNSLTTPALISFGHCFKNIFFYINSFLSIV